MSEPGFCYDFPRVVIHRPSCPRYAGGVCHPLPTPVEPYTGEEAQAVEAYAEVIGGLDEDLRGHELAKIVAAKIGGKVFTATGQTAEPVGVTPDARVKELLDLGMDYDEALAVCADPRYAGVLELVVDEPAERRLN